MDRVAIEGTWGSREWMTNRNEILLDWFNGDRDALQFLMMISDATELWDDLIDKDKEIAPHQINKAFFYMLAGIPENSFYAKHREYLTPVIIQCINSWHDANILEYGDRNQRIIAYTLRNMDLQLVQAIVFLTSGYSKMREVSALMWIEFGAKQDDILEWVGDKA